MPQDGFYWFMPTDESEAPEVVELSDGTIWRTGRDVAAKLSTAADAEYYRDILDGRLIGPLAPPTRHP